MIFYLVATARRTMNVQMSEGGEACPPPGQPDDCAGAMPLSGKSRFNILKKRENPGGWKFIFMDILVCRGLGAGGCAFPLLVQKNKPRAAIRNAGGARFLRCLRPMAGVA
jgi:hypothetical protein